MGGMVGAAICFGVAAWLEGILHVDARLDAVEQRPAANLPAPQTLVTITPKVNLGKVSVNASLNAPENRPAANLPAPADPVMVAPEVESPDPSRLSVFAAPLRRRLSPELLTIIRSFAAAVLTLIAIALMIASAYYFRPGVELQYLTEGGVTLLIGGLALGGALMLSRARIQTLVPSDAAFSGKRTRWWMLGLGIVFLAIVSEISGKKFQLQELQDVNPHVQFALLFLGVLFVGWGLAGKIRLNLSETSRRDSLLLSVIVGVGLVVRVWGLDLTARFMQDEAVFIDALSHFSSGANPGLLNGGGAYTISLVYPYWNALTVNLFGHNLIGLRIASSFLGVLMIPVAYGLARVLFDKKFALVAALFVATFPPLIQFSRISWGHLGDALFGLMALMFVARAVKGNQRADWAFAGVSLGLTQYFYEVGRLLYPPLILVWFILLIFSGKLRLYWRGFLIVAIAAVLVAAPIYYAIAVQDAPVTPRLNNSMITREALGRLMGGILTDENRLQAVGRLATPFLAYIQHPDSMGEYYGGFEGLVLPQLVPLFLLGVCFALWHLRRPVAILLIGLLLVSSANIFANDPGLAPRFVAFSPLIPILMAVGLYSILGLLSLNRRWLVTASAVIIALWQIYFYFGIHLPYYNITRRRASPEHDIFDAVLRTPDLPANTEVFLVDAAPTIDYGRASGLYNFLQDHPYQLQAPNQADFDPSVLPHDHNYAFFIAPDDGISFDKIRQAFPNVRPPVYSTYPIPAWDEYIMFLWMKPAGNSTH
jgi:hypothetical protein